MKITIENIGPIDSFEIDIKKDFHVIFGRNNIGKSYALTIAYLVVKTFTNLLPKRRLFSSRGMFRVSWPFWGEFDPNVIQKGHEIKNKAKNLQQSREIDITDLVSMDIQNFLSRSFLSEMNSSFLNTFSNIGNLKNQFSGNVPRISIETQEIVIDVVVKDNALCIDKVITRKKYKLKKIAQRRDAKRQPDEMLLYCSDKSEGALFQRYLQHCILEPIFVAVSEVSTAIAGVYYLPASRSGLYRALSAFGQIVAELSKNRSFIKKKIELPGISEPLSDYFIQLSEIEKTRLSGINPDLEKAAGSIEHDLLHGKVEFDVDTKQIIFVPEGTNLKLELGTTSSMVSELAPVVSYLRYILPVGDKDAEEGLSQPKRPLVFIEEPEAHLHPDIQIKLMAIFAELIKRGAKLVLSSHSNFVFNKINNLILKKDIDVNSISAVLFSMGQKGSIGKTLPISELGIDDENFLPVADALMTERIQILNESFPSEENGE